MRQRYQDCQPYLTKDGSTIRELIHPNLQPGCRQSLAEASVPANSATLLHCHKSSEEIYFITAGAGAMTLGDRKIMVHQGDSILIRPGTPHKIENTGDSTLKILCCCTPPYAHHDTEIMIQEPEFYK
ncbi:MAG: cupin domain-containing protein [Desulfobulbaceae bacterium]|nr:cupin domain-containing protein [Desulfobulbaceae bacterium]HIJ79038.1 cupin domain-containing protein [Deltaproteobacteria bacterium]